MSNDQNNILDNLWIRFLNGDDSAFEEIYNSTINRLISYGYKLTNDKQLVQDTLHDIFLNLYRRREKQGYHIENLKGYLFISLKHNIIKDLKKFKTIDTSVEDGKFDSSFNFEFDIETQLINLEIRQEKEQKVSSIIQKLTSKQREIIYLRFMQGLSYIEIGRILVISPESARKQIYRILSMLRKIIE